MTHGMSNRAGQPELARTNTSSGTTQGFPDYDLVIRMVEMDADLIAMSVTAGIYIEPIFPTKTPPALLTVVPPNPEDESAAA